MYYKLARHLLWPAPAGSAGDDDFVEYDLDNEDENWLQTYNAADERLSDMKFERMLRRLRQP
jgi:hypothetical protein